MIPINTEWLNYLLVVSHSKSFNTAAQKLYITRQSLNTAITNLEKELNLKIFDRGYTGVSLTKDGQEVVRVAQEILNNIAYLKTLHVDNTVPKAFSDNLNIYVAPVMNFYFSQKIHSNIHLHLQTLDAEGCFKLFANGTMSDGIFFVVIFDEKDILPFFNDDTFICTQVMKDHLVVLLAKDHELIRYKSVSVASLLKYPLATFQTNNQLNCPYRYIFPKSATPIINISTDNIFTYIDAIKNRISISPISAFTYQHSELLYQNPDIAYINLKPVSTFRIYLLCPKDYYQQHLTSINLLQSMLKETVEE